MQIPKLHNGFFFITLHVYRGAAQVVFPLTHLFNVKGHLSGFLAHVSRNLDFY